MIRKKKKENNGQRKQMETLLISRYKWCLPGKQAKPPFSFEKRRGGGGNITGLRVTRWVGKGCFFCSRSR